MVCQSNNNNKRATSTRTTYPGQISEKLGSLTDALPKNFRRQFFDVDFLSKKSFHAGIKIDQHSIKIAKNMRSFGKCCLGCSNSLRFPSEVRKQRCMYQFALHYHHLYLVSCNASRSRLEIWDLERMYRNASVCRPYPISPVRLKKLLENSTKKCEVYYM